MSKIDTEQASMDVQSLRRLRKQGVISRAEYYGGVSLIHEELRDQARARVLENGYSPEAQSEYMYFEKEFNRFKAKEYQEKQRQAEEAYENELKNLTRMYQ